MKKSTKTSVALATMFLAVQLSSCATNRESILAGAGVGAGVGALVGGQVSSNKKPEDVMIGSVTGALFGGLLGYLGFQDRVHSEAKTNAKMNMPPINIDERVVPPVVRRVWVPEKIKDDNLIEGHYQWIIERHGIWKSK